METLAILNYLTRHYDPDFKFSFEDPLDSCTAEQWMAWQNAGLGKFYPWLFLCHFLPPPAVPIFVRFLENID